MKGFSVKPIDSFECKDWVLNKHYAKRMPPIEYSFGLFDAENVLQGIVTYGTPVSNPLRNLWKNEFKVIELNRLVVNEGLDKNSLSYFVSKSINKLPKPLVLVSYADTSQNHTGYIYQATNWIYTGLSAKRKDWTIEGMEGMHGATIADLSRGQVNRVQYLKDKFKEKFSIEERSRKHRYFYFTGTKKERKKMLEMLPYDIQKFPKGDNKRYDASYLPLTQFKMF